MPVSGEYALQLLELLREEQLLKDAKEAAAIQASGKIGLRGSAEVLPLRDGREDWGQYEANIPPRFYWSRRKQYGEGLFNTDDGIKDLKRHHPEFFPTTISGKITSGFGGKYDGRTTTSRRRVNFGRGTLDLTTK